MKKLLTVTFLSVVLVACQTSTNTEKDNSQDSIVKESESIIVDKPLTGIEDCYRFIAQRDTYDIRITRNGELSNGMMHFNNYEKDDSKGEFKGQIVTANIIKAIYRFESEGMKSTREIFLRDEGDQLVTGIGDEDVKGDSAFIKNPDNISFTGPVYKKMNCSEME